MKLLPILAAFGLMVTPAVFSSQNTPPSPVTTHPPQAVQPVESIEVEQAKKKLDEAHAKLDAAQHEVIKAKTDVRNAKQDLKKVFHQNKKGHHHAKEHEKKELPPVDPSKKEPEKKEVPGSKPQDPIKEPKK